VCTRLSASCGGETAVPSKASSDRVKKRIKYPIRWRRIGIKYSIRERRVRMPSSGLVPQISGHVAKVQLRGAANQLRTI
jgi:hypothetical protein